VGHYILLASICFWKSEGLQLYLFMSQYCNWNWHITE